MNKYNCTFKNIKKLTILLENLTILECSGNRLKTIPAFQNLFYLNCGCNKIRKIPLLSKLEIFACHENRIKSIKGLSDNLAETSISENKIKDCSWVAKKSRENVYLDYVSMIFLEC